jgi:hypothetical protein
VLQATLPEDITAQDVANAAQTLFEAIGSIDDKPDFFADMAFIFKQLMSAPSNSIETAGASVPYVLDQILRHFLTADGNFMINTVAPHSIFMKVDRPALVNANAVTYSTITIPRSVFPGDVTVGSVAIAIYPNARLFVQNRTSYTVVSPVYSINVKDAPLQFQDPVCATLAHIVPINDYKSCVYWSYEKSTWDTTGCWVDSTGESHSTCCCTHLTDYALVTGNCTANQYVTTDNVCAPVTMCSLSQYEKIAPTHTSDRECAPRDEDTLSPGVIVLIVFGSLTLVIQVFVVVWLIRRWRKPKYEQLPSMEETMARIIGRIRSMPSKRGLRVPFLQSDQ